MSDAARDIARAMARGIARRDSPNATLDSLNDADVYTSPCLL